MKKLERILSVLLQLVDFVTTSLPRWIKIIEQSVVLVACYKSEYERIKKRVVKISNKGKTGIIYEPSQLPNAALHKIKGSILGKIIYSGTSDSDLKKKAKKAYDFLGINTGGK